MATNTILQYLDQSNADGEDYGITGSNRRQTETYLAGATIAIGDLVAFDFSTSGGESEGDIAVTVIPAISSSTDSICVVGFAQTAAGAGERVDVTVAGVHSEAKCKSNVAKGDRLTISAVSAEADTYVNTDTVPIVGYALTDFVADSAAGIPQTGVMVIKQF